MADDRRLIRLEALARRVRAFLEPHWARWHVAAGSPGGRRTLSEGTCGRSSRFLYEVLRAEGYAVELAFGSPVECDCGFHTRWGWRGHAWVICRDLERIVDVTADQFGAGPVVIARLDDPRYRRGHDVAEEEFIAERQRVATRLLSDWREHSAANWPDALHHRRDGGHGGG